MSGQSILQNVPAITLRPGPNLTIVRQPDGMTTASMDFTCRKFDIESPIVLAKLAKGTPIRTLYPNIGSRFEFLQVDGWTNRDEKGAYAVVSVDFKGADVSGDEVTFEGSVVYTRNNALADSPIFTNPRFIADLTSDEKETIRLGSLGLVAKSAESDASTYYIRYLKNDEIQNALITPAAIWWWDHVVTQGNETWLRATSEWTKSATGKGQLSSSVLADFGKIVTPPGSPSAPTNETWLFTGATENISVSGDGTNSFSLTYTSGLWPTTVYDY